MSGAGKIEPRKVNVHAIASRLVPFLVPVSEIHSVAGQRLDPGSHPSGLVIGLDVHAETSDGERQFGIVLGPYVDPTALAGELEALALTIVKRAAIDLGLDEIAAAQTARQLTRDARIAARRETIAEVPRNVTCDFCSRSVFVIVDGVRLCKRHAEEAGERPHGKIGSEL